MLCIYLNEKTWSCNFVPLDAPAPPASGSGRPRECTLINDECAFRPLGPFKPYDAPAR